MSAQIKRREFITLLAGAAATMPVAARGERRVRRVGILLGPAADDPESQVRVIAFVQALAQLGWNVGDNLRIDTRMGGSDAGQARKLAAELLALKPDVLVPLGSLTARALLRATRTVPIVFVSVSDPVGAGIVASLARPGGNATGFAAMEFAT